MRLSELSTGQKAKVVKILGHGAFRKRLIEMGFIKGRVIDVLQHAPLRDPIKYRILDYEVSLRKTEADLVEVIPADEKEVGLGKKSARHETTDCDFDRTKLFNEESHTINVALIGNPNCGKTALFNFAKAFQRRLRNYISLNRQSV